LAIILVQFMWRGYEYVKNEYLKTSSYKNFGFLIWEIKLCQKVSEYKNWLHVIENLMWCNIWNFHEKIEGIYISELDVIGKFRTFPCRELRQGILIYT
jgi:hypothetical protein